LFPIINIFSNSNQERWHFVNIKDDVKQEKRQVLRRITVAPGEKLRTATERLSLLDLQEISADLEKLTHLEIQECHDKAFDVEAVTKKFFAQYRLVFGQVENLIKPTLTNNKATRLSAQKLFNRLMFIVFEKDLTLDSSFVLLPKMLLYGTVYGRLNRFFETP
jgi:hypothetical protein